MKEGTKKIIKKMISQDEDTIRMIKISPALSIEMLEKRINFMRKKLLE